MNRNGLSTAAARAPFNAPPNSHGGENSGSRPSRFCLRFALIPSAVVAILLLALAPLCAHSLVPPATPTADDLIAIDVGHSLAHPGATSARGVSEFQFNLRLADAVSARLIAAGTRTLVIGKDGLEDDLVARTSAAHAAGATFFLSIHHDSVQPQYLMPWTYEQREGKYSDRFSGFSLFVSRNNGFLAQSLSCAKTIGAALIAAGFKPSEHHAEMIRGESRAWADRDRGVYYYDELAVLHRASQPAVLLEAGVLVNRNDEVSLASGSTQADIAGAVLRGLQSCGATSHSKAISAIRR